MLLNIQSKSTPLLNHACLNFFKAQTMNLRQRLLKSIYANPYPWGTFRSYPLDKHGFVTDAQQLSEDFQMFGTDLKKTLKKADPQHGQTDASQGKSPPRKQRSSDSA
jgi:hypothetical protein